MELWSYGVGEGLAGDEWRVGSVDNPLNRGKTTGVRQGTIHVS